MDWTGAKLCALAHSRCSISLRLKSFSQPGSGAVITTSHSSVSVMDVGQTFALYQACHGLLGFFEGLAHGCPPAHDPPVIAQADPAPGHVQAMRMQHEVHGALGPDRPVIGCVPAHQDFVVP